MSTTVNDLQNALEQQPVPWSLSREKIWGLIPACFTVFYPFFLDAYHGAMGSWTVPRTAGDYLVATLTLIACYAVPAVGILFALKMRRSTTMRRLAYATVVAPTAYVFMGVLTYMVGSQIPDEVIWAGMWVAIAAIAFVSPEPGDGSAARSVSRWRVVHGAIAAILVFYVVYHVGNHLIGFVGGPATENAGLAMGDVVYRNVVIEPIMIILFLVTTGIGIRLFWRWSARQGDFFRTIQLATGIFMAVYIVGHMDSAFIFSRSFLQAPTNWAFADGGPQGLIHNAWNIRLVPHYSLGVFFILTHLACGARQVLLKHGFNELVLNRVWGGAVASSAVIATIIIVAMCVVGPFHPASVA